MRFLIFLGFLVSFSFKLAHGKQYICEPGLWDDVGTHRIIYINIKHRVAFVSTSNDQETIPPSSVHPFPDKYRRYHFSNGSELGNCNIEFNSRMLGGFPLARYSCSGIRQDLTCNLIPSVNHTDHHPAPSSNFDKNDRVKSTILP